MAPARTRTAALCLLALQLAAQLLAAQAQALPPMPRWAKGPAWTGRNPWPSYSVDQGRKNRGMMAAANAAGTTYDFLLYGDRCARLRPA